MVRLAGLGKGPQWVTVVEMDTGTINFTNMKHNETKECFSDMELSCAVPVDRSNA